MIHMFPGVKSLLLSQTKPPQIIKFFFENEKSEIYMWHIQSIMSVFQSHIQGSEKENNSAYEVS
jgi:hypothetical protein